MTSSCRGMLYTRTAILSGVTASHACSKVSRNWVRVVGGLYVCLMNNHNHMVRYLLYEGWDRDSEQATPTFPLQTITCVPCIMWPGVVMHAHTHTYTHTHTMASNWCPNPEMGIDFGARCLYDCYWLNGSSVTNNKLKTHFQQRTTWFHALKMALICLLQGVLTIITNFMRGREEIILWG